MLAECCAKLWQWQVYDQSLVCNNTAYGKLLSSLYLILELPSLAPSASTFKGTGYAEVPGSISLALREGLLPPEAVHKSTLGCEVEQ